MPLADGPRTIATAMAACAKNALCSGVYDSACDATGEFVMCDSRKKFASSSQSCVYRKPISTTTQAPSPVPMCDLSNKVTVVISGSSYGASSRSKMVPGVRCCHSTVSNRDQLSSGVNSEPFKVLVTGNTVTVMRRGGWFLDVILYCNVAASPAASPTVGSPVGSPTAGGRPRGVYGPLTVQRLSSCMRRVYAAIPARCAQPKVIHTCDQGCLSALPGLKRTAQGSSYCGCALEHVPVYAALSRAIPSATYLDYA